MVDSVDFSGFIAHCNLFVLLVFIHFLTGLDRQLAVAMCKHKVEIVYPCVYTYCTVPTFEGANIKADNLKWNWKRLCILKCQLVRAKCQTLKSPTARFIYKYQIPYKLIKLYTSNSKQNTHVAF